MIEVRPNELVVTENPTAEQMQAAVDNPENKSVELVGLKNLQDRLKTLILERLELKKKSEVGAPARYNRRFARRQWRDFFADGTFRYRKKLPSCPAFNKFKKVLKDEKFQQAVSSM